MWSTLDMLQHSQSLAMHFTILGGPLRRFWGAQPTGSVMSRLGLYIKLRRPRLCLYVDTWLPRLLLYDWFWPPRSELIIAVLLYIRPQQMDRAQVQAWAGIPVPKKQETKEVIFSSSFIYRSFLDALASLVLMIVTDWRPDWLIIFWKLTVLYYLSFIINIEPENSSCYQQWSI